MRRREHRNSNDWMAGAVRGIGLRARIQAEVAAGQSEMNTAHTHIAAAKWLESEWGNGFQMPSVLFGKREK